MDIEEIISFCQATGIHNRFYPDAAALYRKFCRIYSKTFHTPLFEVEKLDAIHVVQAVTEDRLEGFDLEDDTHVMQLLERILVIRDPNYIAEAEEDLKDWIEEAEADEEERVKNNISLTKALKPTYKDPFVRAAVKAAEEKVKKELPKQGGINLSYLDESDNEG